MASDGGEEHGAEREKSLSELIASTAPALSAKSATLTTKAGLNHWLVSLLQSKETHEREKLQAARQLADLNGLSGARDADLRRMPDKELHELVCSLLPILEPCGVLVDVVGGQLVRRRRGRPPKARTEVQAAPKEGDYVPQGNRFARRRDKSPIPEGAST